MHAVYLIVAIGVAALISLLALWVADRTEAWGDRRALHAFALIAPFLCSSLLGATVIKMLVVACTRFSLLDTILSILLIGTLLVSAAWSLTMHWRRYGKTWKLTRMLFALELRSDDSRPRAALLRALHATGGGIVPQLRVVDDARPLAFSLGIFKPTIFVSTGLLDILDDAELEATLAHEVIHLKHGDPLFAAGLGWLKDASAGVGRIAWNRYEADRERTADMLAARAISTPQVLAEALVKVGESLDERVSQVLEGVGGGAGRPLTPLAAWAMLALLLTAGALSAPLVSNAVCMRLFCPL